MKLAGFEVGIDRPFFLIADEHPHRLVDVNQHHQQQAEFDGRQQRIAVLHHVGVAIERLGAEEDDQVTGDVNEEIKK